MEQATTDRLAAGPAENPSDENVAASAAAENPSAENVAASAAAENTSAENVAASTTAEDTSAENANAASASDARKGAPAVPMTHEELCALLNNASSNPVAAGWGAYRYLSENYRELGSEMSRRLLNTALILPHERPSRLHSCLLAVALKLIDVYPDFRYPDFLKVWGWDGALSEEDTRPIHYDGRQIPPLADRARRALQIYTIRHSGAGSDGVMPMMAVRVWDIERQGRKCRIVKLVGAAGQELSAEVHVFAGCKQADILGRLFDVLAEGYRVSRAVPSRMKPEDIFPPVAGYVESFDPQYNFYHIYDSLSRHFVAAAPEGTAAEGDFVMFCPVVPSKDKFKSAVITAILDATEGLRCFGTYDATVEHIDDAGHTYSYHITSALPATPEGRYASRGSAPLATVPAGLGPLLPGQRVKLVMFLRRMADKVKRNYVVRTIAEPHAVLRPRPEAEQSEPEKPANYTETMAAVKVFSHDDGGRVSRSVKLVAAGGEELFANIRLFPAGAPVEGRLFEVRVVGGKVRGIEPSEKKIDELFRPVVGYVDYKTKDGSSFHIYDSLSRHYFACVADSGVKEGDFVMFAPMPATDGRNNSAVITSVLTEERGLELFGTYDAVVTMAYHEENYFTYRITSPLRPAEGGKIDREGIAPIRTCTRYSGMLDDDCTVRLVLFLRRDREKMRNYVAKTYLLD